ncbi:MAG: hypothetical protein R3D65_16980 [Zhengella sp.]|uniref:hypothetical protein n=1 Tax=Zhengella sp. TaxID=2282762 RepID=UPI0035279E9F
MNTGQHIAVRVPFATTRHGSGKRIIGPDGATGYNSPRIDSTLVKAIARAHRWNRMLESGEVTTIKDIARAEKINPSYISRILRLTLLAPDIVEAILDGGQGPEVTLARLLEPFPVEWAEQEPQFHGKIL